MEVSDPGDTIALLGTPLQTVKVIKPIAYPTANTGHPTSTADLPGKLGHRLAERRRLQSESSLTHVHSRGLNLMEQNFAIFRKR